MQIRFSPIRHEHAISLGKSRDILIINEEAFDFTVIPEGATLPRVAVNSPWLASDVERINGQICLTILLPHGANASQATLFPTPISVEEDGLIQLPLYEDVTDEDTA